MAAPYPDRLGAALLVVVLAALVVSGISPYERGTWLMEVAPVLIAVPSSSPRGGASR
jgi:putative membrane protein